MLITNLTNPNQGDSDMETSEGINEIKTTIEELNIQAQHIKKTLAYLAGENNKLKQSVLEIKKYEKDAEYYKNLSESKLKECCALAEEIITMRTHLDRKNSTYLKSQIEQTRTEGSDDNTPSKRRRKSSLKKYKSKESEIKKEVKWKDELEVRSPRRTY